LRVFAGEPHITFSQLQHKKGEKMYVLEIIENGVVYEYQLANLFEYRKYLKQHKKATTANVWYKFSGRLVALDVTDVLWRD